MTKTKPQASIYQIKVTLKNIRPPIWRRFLVSSTLRLDHFHEVLQAVMGWTNSHLHGFVTRDNQVYGIPDPDFDFPGLRIKEERRSNLAALLPVEGAKIRYDYDFGDSWEHDVVLEKILPFTPEQPLPYCLKGKRACPPEDCGGPWGYADLLHVLADPEHEDYEELVEWLAEDFDPEAFNANGINALLHP